MIVEEGQGRTRVVSLPEPPSTGGARGQGAVSLVPYIWPRSLISHTQCLQPRRPTSWGLWSVVEHSEVRSLRHWGQLNGQGRHLATVISSKCLSLGPGKKLYLLLREEINAKVCHQLLHLGRGFFLTSSRLLLYSWLNHEAYEQWCPSTCFVVPNAE